jgi:hypothetical protein
VGLDVPHQRPLARLAARSAIHSDTVRDWHAGPYAPPAGSARAHTTEDVDVTTAELCIAILRGLLLGDDLSMVHDRLAPDVTAWSPHLFTVTRDRLLTAIDGGQIAGETLSEIALEATDIASVRSSVYLEWRLTGRFTSPGIIADDVLVEPTGRLLETAGLQVVTFVDDLVVSIRCYYDDLALFEQLITSR